MCTPNSKQSDEISKGPPCGPTNNTSTSKDRGKDTISEKGNNSVAKLGKEQVTTIIDADESENGTNGFSIQEFVQFVKRKGQRGLLQEYDQVVAATEQLSGSCNICKKRINLSKNRYQDVPCYDDTRVILSTDETFTSTKDVDDCADFIHANFVEGYNQKNAYIATQGPLPVTIADFWKMIWEQNSVVIVMVTRIIEMGRIKSGQYWPVTKGSSTTHQGFKVENMDINVTNPEFLITQLKLTAVKQEEFRIITHLQFLSWPDFGIPSNPTIMLNFLQIIRTEQSLGVSRLKNKWTGDALGPPMVIHCSAGLGRTGTLITIDICTKQIVGGEKINIRKIVEKLRSQRAYSIQSSDQYLFCYATVIAFIRDKELTPVSDLESISIL